MLKIGHGIFQGKDNMAVENYNPERSPDLSGRSRRERLMAEGNVPTEGASPTGSVKQVEMAANAPLSDEQQRLQSAQKLLGTPLTSTQEEAILQAHEAGKGETGKSGVAGIDNYTREQIAQKAQILKEAGFTKEQRRRLMESGITGVLPASEITINPADYATDARLNSIAQQIRATATAGGTDENFFNRTSARIERLQDERTVDSTLANNLLASVELWRLSATTRPPERRVEQRQVTSAFDRVMANIRDLQTQLPSPDRNRLLQGAIDQRDAMRVEASNLGLFNNAKEELFKIYYDSRVEITRKQKLDVNETTRDGRPKLQELAEMQQDPNSWEARRGFWSDPALEATYGGIVDDFYKKSLDMIRAVVQNRKANLPADLEGLTRLWNYDWEWDPDETPVRMANFDEVRERVERERKKRYFVPNRGDYESWIQLVADDLDEVEESTPFILDYIKTKFQPSDPNKVFETVEQEKDKIVKALDKFSYERGYEIGSPEYRKVRRVKSRLLYKVNLTGAAEFAKVLHISWDPYFKFLGATTRSFQDTETQDHFVDTVLLDDEGMVMLALDEFEANDGEYFRYGRNTAATQNTFQIGEGQKWQAERREQILKTLVNQELKPMAELLRNHPVFQRLKAQMDDLDSSDSNFWNDPAYKTRWVEYTEKALEWERNRTIGDPRDKTQRVLFQHPRARSLTDDEVTQLYQPIQKRHGETDSQFNRRLREKRERMRTVIDTALEIATSFQQDAYFGLARHNLTPAQKQELGLPVDDEAIPHSRLMRVLLGRAIREDALKPPKRQRFKLTHVLQKMGLPRSLPLFSNWRLGAHDDIRPGFLVNGINRVPELLELLEEKRRVRALDPDDPLGGDFKTSITRMPEEERQFEEMMELYVREEFPTYFNLPGHDTAGGGVKEMRNVLSYPYGQSWGTVELSSLVKNMWLGEQAFLPAFGCSTWQQFVAQAKGGNEIVFQRMGGLFESPRDAEDWLKRIGVIVEVSKLLTSGGEKGGTGILNDGWASGFYRWRALNRAASFRQAERQHMYKASDGKLRNIDEYTAITDPDAAYREIDEKTYEAYVRLAGEFAAPLMTLFAARLKLENVYGRSPGTAMFLNTLTWYSVSQWMDRNWEEYRGKYGNALDVNLHMARKFIRTVLYESRLIYYDDQWDRLMLGYTIPKNEWERIQEGPYYDFDRKPPQEVQRIRQLMKTYKDKDFTDDEIKNLGWNDLPETELKSFRPIKRFIRYGVNANGETIDYSIDQHGRIKFADGDKIIEGYAGGHTVEGILDAFPQEWRRRIITRHNQTEEPWIIPMGLNTEYPETNGVIKQLTKYGEGSGIRDLYESLLTPDQVLRQTRPRITIKR